ncbi:(Fe-S)-binding protein [Thermodesulfobacteriota bacterium]
MSSLERLLFALVFVGAFAFLFKNVFRLVATICLGRSENRFDRLWSRVGDMLAYGFGQLRVIKEKFGFNHFFLFWGFMTLVLVNLEFLVAGLFPNTATVRGFSLLFIGKIPYGLLMLTADIMSLVVIACVVIAFVRRTFFRPEHIDPTADAYFILSLVASLMIAFFGMNACEAAQGKLLMAGWMPISNGLSALVSGMSPDGAHSLARVFWWIHAIVLLFFMNYLPYSKHLHVLTAIPNCFFKAKDIVTTVPKLQFKKGEEFGISKVVQFKWKDLLDFMACTECGRCQAVCPAHNTQKPLNPKQIIHEGKLNIFKNGSAIRATRPADMLAPAPAACKMNVPLMDGGEESMDVEAIWACTTCGACMQVCPVFIEHAPKIIQIRQHLVMEKAEFPEELIALFEASEQRSNPWGIAPTDRTKWTTDLNVPVIADGVKAEYLFYVGCAGAFDSRARKVTVAVTEILNKAGVSWGILGNEEKCCGDSLRRLGNEYVFDKMVKENLETFEKFGIKKIVTYCPHCFTTLKNDYKQYGADLEVIHHTELINTLIKQGKIKPSAALNGSTVMHDSCYLGRYNQLYSEPRDIVKACSGGRAPVEMERCGEKSFCCGAGGGRMWMEELIGKRIYLDRTQEALKTNASTIAVACPYCMTMFEDGVKDEKAGDRVMVKDVAEIVAESIK